MYIIVYNMDKETKEETEFVPPEKNGYTIYSKSGCPNCLKIKTFLCEKGLNQFIINCDEYILDDKQKFLNYIETIAEKSVKLFPMVFLNGKYIGGYIETLLQCEEEEAFSDKIIF